MSPDTSDFWPTDVIKRHRLEVTITKEQFEAIKASIEEDKKNEDSLTFQTIGDNCTEYVNAKARMAGFLPPTKRCIMVYILPPWMRKMIDALCRNRIVSIVSHLVFLLVIILATVVGNAILLALGASRVHQILRGRIRVLPSHHTWWHFFDPRSLQFHPPRFVAHNVFVAAKRWRDKKLKNPHLTEQKKLDVRYQVPEHWRVEKID